jgi:hypothetical protein
MRKETMMRRLVLLLATVGAMLTLYVGTASAQSSTAETLDANTLSLGESVNAYTAVPGQKAVQTFTAEHNGQLTTAKLKIHLDSGWGSIDSAEVQITTVDPATGLPTSNVLASSTIPSSDIPLLPANIDPATIPMTTLTFENPATVEAGKQYAIVMDTIASNTDLHFLRWTTTLQEYSDGQGMWINDNGSFGSFLPSYPERNNASDQVFAVYVTAPVSDTTAPEVDAVDPAEGVTGVARSSNVKATFSEAVQEATLTSETVQLFSGKSTKPIKATLSWDPSTDPNSVTLTPSKKLGAKTSYTAKIKGGQSGVKDLADNPLDQDPNTSGNQDMVWSFTTGAR